MQTSTRTRIRKALRHLVFATLPAFALLVLLELAGLVYYFHQRGSESFALEAAVRDLRSALAPVWARRTVHEFELPPAIEIYDALYSSAGERLLESFKSRYEASFSELVEAVSEVDSKLVVLYVPPPFDDEISRRVDRHDRAFYRRLAEAHDAGFLDATETLAAYPRSDAYLLPHNTHLSRLGNRILAGWLAQQLKRAPYLGYRTSFRSDRRPDLLGDLPPGSRRVWANEHLPFLVTTNAQGLRMDHDLEFPKRRQRILLLGDSFTFGINLHDVHTYPAILQSLLTECEIVNAGVPGYSIPQEAGLFSERARYVEADVTVLQVLFNDLYGFFYFERSLFARANRERNWFFGKRRLGGEIYPPSELEKELLTGIGVRF